MADKHLLDDDSHHNMMLGDCNDDDRRGFVVKVYGILAVMMSVTFGSVAAVKLNEDLNDSMIDPNNGVAIGLFWTSWIVGIICQCAIACCIKVARKVPLNYILLGIFTLCWAYMVTYICAFYEQATVLQASISTAAITITLTAYAMFTKTDFTKMCGAFMCWGLLLILMVQMLLSLLSIFIFTFTDTWIPFVAGFGVILYGLFLIIDTQLILGGKRYELTIDDFVIGAMILYLDIIMIFLYLLKIFGGNR